jgi:hypothetical protein
MSDQGFPSVFLRLREILKKHARSLSVKTDRADHFCLEAPIGPATLRAWGGKAKRPAIDVAWIQIGKSYVSYHLMGVYAHPAFLSGCSKALMARMQGKSCFNFKVVDEPLFKELEALTAKTLAGMKKAGFTS